MAVVKALMRYFGYFYHGLLALFLLAVSGMALGTDMHSVKFGILPWQGESLTWWLLGLSIVGLLAVVMAIKGILPLLFFVWSVVVLGFLVKGYVFSGYYFATGELKTALYLIAGAAIATAGAWFAWRRPARR